MVIVELGPRHFPAGKLYRPLSVGKSHDEGQRDVETSDVALIEPTDELPDPSSPNCDRFVGHYLGADSQTVSRGWINSDPEVRGIDNRRCHLANHNRGMCFRQRISLDNNRRSRFSIVPRRGDGDHIAAYHCSFRLAASNSETSSIQSSASSSLRRLRRATCAATRFRTDRNRGSGTSRRNSRRPCLRRRSRIILIRSAGPGTLISSPVKTTVTRYETEGKQLRSRSPIL